jgi:hypothetical protein
MTDRPLYRDLRTVFLDSWSDANGWASMLRMIADRAETEPATAAWLRAEADRAEDLEVPWSYMGDSFRVYEHGQTSAAEHLRVIAAELETSTPENR